MRLFNPSITPYALLAVLGWSVGVGVVLADMFVAVSDDWGHLGIVIAGGAAVLNVSGMIHAMEDRQRRMVEVWRQAMAEPDRLRRIE